MSWAAFKDLAKQRLNDKGLQAKVQDSLVISEANHIILIFFGPEAHEKARAVYFRDGVLTIAILSDDLFNEIESQQQEVLAILNSKFEEKLVEDLRFLS